MSNEDDFRKLSDMFEAMFSDIMANGEVDLVPVLLGWCNCCFMQDKGHFLKYRFADGEITEVFVCLDCRVIACDPEGDCKKEGASFAYTLDLDQNVTNKDKK